MLSVSFEGLCAFQCGTQVVAPEVQRHIAVLAANEDSADVANGTWSPSMMFKDPATGKDYYIWNLSERTVTLGTLGSPPQWKFGPPMLSLTVKHAGKKTKESVTPLIKLGKGYLTPFDEFCFEWTFGGAQTGKFEKFPERIRWEGEPENDGKNDVVKSDAGHIVLRGRNPALAISNTFPEPNGLHHFHGYYEIFDPPIRDPKEQWGLRPAGDKCEKTFTTSVGSGNCTPCGDVPCP